MTPPALWRNKTLQLTPGQVHHLWRQWKHPVVPDEYVRGRWACVLCSRTVRRRLTAPWRWKHEIAAPVTSTPDASGGPKQ